MSAGLRWRAVAVLLTLHTGYMWWLAFTVADGRTRGAGLLRTRLHADSS